MRMFAHKRCGRLDRQKNEVGLLKYHACRRHARCHHPCGNLGIPPATEAARKRLHASAANATSVKPAFVSKAGAKVAPIVLAVLIVLRQTSDPGLDISQRVNALANDHRALSPNTIPRSYFPSRLVPT